MSSLTTRYVLFVMTALIFSLSIIGALADNKIQWTEQEKPIVEKIRHLRDVPDDQRAQVTKDLAIKIRALPATGNRLELATDLASLSTEGDYGKDTLQTVADTLAETLRLYPLQGENGHPAYPYFALAELVRYEHVQASLDNPQYTAAMAQLATDDEHRAKADFTLTDLEGRQWTLKSLRGKVVLVNFWATWCPPCRKELPDLQALSQRFADEGLVVLAISDEDEGKVKPFIEKQKVTYTVLLDPGHKVADEFAVDGVPKTFIYDRDGKLVAQAIDMRTRKQFLEMLDKAGLQ